MTQEVTRYVPRQQLTELAPDGDFAVTIRVRNGLLLRAIRRAGFRSVNAFCKAHGLSQRVINNYATMTFSPYRTSGRLNASAQYMCDALNADVTELFPAEFLARVLPRRATTEVTLTEGQLATLLRQPPQTPEDLLVFDDARDQIARTIATLTPREERALRLYYPLDGGEERTLWEIGEQFDVTPERIRQIIAKALRKLKHPARTSRMLEAAATFGVGVFRMTKPLPRPLAERQADAQIQAPGTIPIQTKAPRPQPEVQKVARTRKMSFPDQKPSIPLANREIDPLLLDLLRKPIEARTDHDKINIGGMLQGLIIRRGGRPLLPAEGQAEYVATLGRDALLIAKHDWFMANLEELWRLYPPAPVLETDT